MFTHLRKIIAPARAVMLIFCGLSGPARAQVDMEINESVWKQKYGVLDKQMNEQAPYAGWLGQDADGDGVKNRDEFTAGTNPFAKLPSEPHFRAPDVTANPTSLSLEFPTVPGKLYQAEGSDSLLLAWTNQFLPNVTGDGSAKTLNVPKSAGSFFRVGVSDQATQGDQVSDWAKYMLGLSPSAPIGSQTSYNHVTLASSLETHNVVTLVAVDTSTAQPPDSATPPGDIGLIRITRSGSILLGAVTVPVSLGGSALEGIDYAPVPDSFTFPAGVSSLDIRITPLFNSSRTSGTTVIVTAGAPGSSGASGNYTLGSPAFGGVTIYPASNPSGTGLAASYYAGSSSTYTSPLNFGGNSASYSYTRTNSTTGTAVVTYTGTPAAPYVVGSQVGLQFTSGNLNISAFNTLNTYAVVAPVTATSFAVGITGTALPSNGNGNAVIDNFSNPVTRLEPAVDFLWNYGTPNGNTYIGPDNYSVSWDAYLSPTTAANCIFQLDADDKARVLLDTNGNGEFEPLEQILENGWDTAATGAFKQSAAIPLVVPATPGNRYRIRVEFVETTGAAKCRFQWKVGNGSFANIPNGNVFINNTDASAGWNASYYGNTTFTLPVARAQTDTAVTNGNNGDWGTGTPELSLGHNNFTAIWTGQVLPQYTQTYYFVARVDDGVKLWVNNQLLVNRWPGGGATDSTGSIDLQAGVFYDLKMEYYESTSAAEARLSWYSGDQAKQIIPTSRLFPTMTGMPPLAGSPPAAAPAITSPTNPVAILGSGTPFSLVLTGSNGGTFSASGLPPWLTLVNGVISGTPPAAGIYQFEVVTTNAAGSGSAIITLEVLAGAGQLTRELWTSGVTGPAIADVPWTSVPSSSDTIAAAEDNANHAANTGERLRGYFIAPATGNYYFWIASSNAAELWISNNSEAVNKVLRAKVTGPAGTASRTWDTQSGQKSQWLSLVAGRKYYLEALHNTGASGAGNNLAVAWFLDPTGTTVNPVANGSASATAAIGGLIPAHAISPWDNPPTTTIPGTLHVTNLQGVEGLGNITATGGAFLRVNGSTAVLQLDYSGLTSGVISRGIYNSSGQVLFDIDAQDKNYPALKTSDGGYTWNMQSGDLAALNNGEVHIGIATLNNPGGEITGTFGKISGSQTAPSVPSYPSWTDLHASSDAANSRFLTQATFGPSPVDMAYVKTNGYRPWIENQFLLPSTRNIPYVLANLSNDPQNPYSSTQTFNSWWKNSVGAPDQLRQRAAFALSEIFVVSDNGPLNNNGRVLADYYDTMLDYSFGNFRDILKQVTLTPAMGVYLDMRGNAAGNIQTGVHPNENYAREILQLFSAGLYRVWPDGTLVLDSKGGAVPTYDQSVITGMARVFTGWNWGQAMSGGRLPTSFSPASNYLDPMVLVPTRHELGTKILLDNVVRPAALVTSQSDTSTDPASTYAVQSTDPVLGPGNLVTTTITNQYDLNGVRDLEMALDNIVNNSAVAPYICRQLIQRLVTSHPKPEYVYRVVRAFNGERNVDGIATGVRGDMKEVFRAILLDYEARSTTAAADVTFGKQREPLLRVTGPARAFPPPAFSNSTYRQLGLQPILITTPVPHRFVNGDNVLLNAFVDSEAATGNLPTPQSYSTANTSPSYALVGATGIATINAPAYQTGDTVALQFTSGTLGTTAPYNTVQNYTVATATPTSFTINIGTTAIGNTSGNTLTPNNFTVNASSLSSLDYNSVGNTVTITATGYVAGHELYLKFSTGGLSGAGFDGVYTIATAGSTFTVTLPSSPANTSGKVLIPRLSGGYNVTTNGSGSAIALQTSGSHNLTVGDEVQINFLVANLGTPAEDGVYTVASIGGPNVFSVTTPTPITNGSQGSNGVVSYPLSVTPWTRNGTVTVGLGTWNMGYTPELNQSPLNSPTVFNFFYPDYQYPGPMALAGMTTPEFQLSNDSNTMNLTNFITGGTINGGNTNGYSGFRSGSVVLDLGLYMTSGQTSDAGVPALVDSLGTLLTGGNLSSAARTTIIGYVANTTNFPLSATPTNTQMRDRVRAIVHLIVTSAEYAIQK